MANGCTTKALHYFSSGKLAPLLNLWQWTLVLPIGNPDKRTAEATERGRIFFPRQFKRIPRNRQDVSHGLVNLEFTFGSQVNVFGNFPYLKRMHLFSMEILALLLVLDCNIT